MQEPFQGKHVLIAGFGVEGVDTAHFFLQEHAKVAVYDRKPEAELDQVLVQSLKNAGVLFFCGSETIGTAFDLVVRSPGIGLHTPLMASFERARVPCTSATRLFFQRCPCPIVGVTGTKGKGTTSSLIAEMLKASGRTVFLVGNIGTPALSILPKIRASDMVVFELSSFQLMDLDQSPHVAVVLMTTIDHLDVHASEAEYVEAKARIAMYQTARDFLIFHADSPNSCAIAEISRAQKKAFSRLHEVADGCFVRGHDLVWREGLKERVIAMREDVRLPGAHNLENVCAAMATAVCLGIEDQAIRAALHAFSGLEHRLEFVRCVKGVSFYNDSFGTTPETAIAAIQAFDAPEVLILGGSSKNSDFSALAQVIVERAERVRGIIGIGTEWPKIKEAIMTVGGASILMMEGLATMKEIVNYASRIIRVIQELQGQGSAI